MAYIVIVLSVLYLCGVKVGVALAISSIILAICSIILTVAAREEN